MRENEFIINIIASIASVAVILLFFILITLLGIRNDLAIISDQTGYFTDAVHDDMRRLEMTVERACDE